MVNSYFIHSSLQQKFTPHLLHTKTCNWHRRQSSEPDTSVQCRLLQWSLSLKTYSPNESKWNCVKCYKGEGTKKWVFAGVRDRVVMYEFSLILSKMLTFTRIFLKKNYCCIINLQCCVNFCCIAKWFSYIHTHKCVCVYTLFHILFHYGLSQDV